MPKTQTQANSVPAHLKSIQWARAIAAIVVVLYHTNSITNDFALQLGATPHWLHLGFAGVDLFFVVSGFVISVVTDRDHNPVGEFFMKRAIRILPFYWAFTLVWLAVMVVGGKPVPGWGEILRSFALIPMYEVPILGVGWTLEHELIFYTIVATTIALNRLRLLPFVLATLWLVGVVLHVIIPTQKGSPPPWDWHLFSLFHIEFLAGVMLYRLRHLIAQMNWRLLIPLGALAFPIGSVALYAIYNADHVPTQPEGVAGLARVLIFGAASTVMISGLLALEAQRPAVTRTWLANLGDLIGNASYALYLSHSILLAILGVIIAHLKLDLIFLWPASVFSWTACIIAAIYWYYLVEKPTLKVLQNLFIRRSRPQFSS